LNASLIVRYGGPGVDDLVDGEPEPNGIDGGEDDVARSFGDDGRAEDPARVALDHELGDPARVVLNEGAGDVVERERAAGAIDALPACLPARR
jgi:hypothetical protein